MPFVKEVFEEKLRIPVNYFNALKNVSVGPRVDVEQVSGEAHSLGELVGLALREMACPMELDLSPKAVQASRDVGSRKPYLFGAAAALFSTLIGTWAYNSSAASGYLRKEEDLTAKIGDLERFDRGIKEATTRESTEKARADYIADDCRAQGLREQQRFAALPPDRRVVDTYHASWVYLLDWLGLEVATTVEPKPGVSPSPAHVAQVLQIVRARGVRVILQEEYYPRGTSETLAKLTGAQLLLLEGTARSGPGQGYLAHVQRMTEQVHAALSR
jgi:hypothetical protein